MIMESDYDFLDFQLIQYKEIGTVILVTILRLAYFDMGLGRVLLGPCACWHEIWNLSSGIIML